MDKTLYIVDGKKYNVASHRLDEFLKDHPTAVVLDSSISEEDLSTIEQANELSSKSVETKDQAAANDLLTEQFMNYKSPDGTKGFYAELEEFVEEGPALPSVGVGGGVNAIDKFLRENSEIYRDFKGAAVRGLVEFSGKVVEKTTGEPLANITLKEQQMLDDMVELKNNATTYLESKYDIDRSEFTEEHQKEVIENIKKQYRNKLKYSTQEKNTENIIKEMEGVDNLVFELGWESEAQDIAEEKADKSFEILDKQTKDNVVRFDYHTQQLNKLSDSAEIIKKAEYNSNEEVAIANKELNRIKEQAQYHMDSVKNLTIEQTSAEMSLEQLDAYRDQLNRNHGWLANFGLLTINGLTGIVEAGEELLHQGVSSPFGLIEDGFNKMYGKDSEVIDNVPEWLKPVYVANKYIKDWRTLRFVNDGLNNIQDWTQEKRKKPKSFSDDDFQWIEWGTNFIFEQSGTIAVLALSKNPTTAMTILGGSAASAKFDDLENSELDNWQRYVISVGTGVGEALSERITIGQFGKVRKTLLASDKFKDGFNQYMKRNFMTKEGLRGNLYDPLEEGFTESVATVNENVLSRYVGGDESVNIFDGVDEAFVGGMWFSTALKSPVLASNMMNGFKSRDTASKMYENSKEIRRIEGLLANKQLSKPQREEYENQILNLINDSNKILEEDLRTVDYMTKEHKAELLDVQRKKDELTRKAARVKSEKGLNKNEVNNELKRLKEQHDGLDNRKNGILQIYKAQRQIELIQKLGTDIFGKDGDLEVISEKNDKDLLNKLIEKNDALEDGDPKKKSLDELVKQSKGQAFVVQGKDGKQTIYINRNKVATQNINAPAHELLHAILFKTVQNSPQTQMAIGKALGKYLNQIDPKQVKNSKFAKRLTQYQDFYKQKIDALQPAVEAGEMSQERANELANTYLGNQAEETLTLFSDALATGDLVIPTSAKQKIADLFRRILQSAGLKSVKFDSAEDVFNFVRDYNHGVAKGKIGKGISTVAKKGALGNLVKGKKKAVEDVVKESKQDLSDEVQSIYDKKGKDGAFEITELYRGMANKIAGKYRDVPGYTTYKDDFVEQLLIDDRGVYGLVMRYNPESGVPLAAYINKYLPSRAIEIADSMFEKEFTLDVTEARGVANEEVEAVEEVADQGPSLRETLGIETDGTLYNKIKSAVLKTFGARLPKVTSKQFKKELQKSFRVELKTAMANLIGTRAVKEQFLRDNFETLYNALSQETINKRFSQFAEPVLDKDGKQLREKTPQGNAVFLKRKITKAEWLSYFLGKNVKPSTKGTRKDALAEALAEELAFDATMEVVKDPEVLDKRKAIDDITGVEQVDNYVEETARQINRDPDTKFSLSQKEINQTGVLARQAIKEGIDNVTNEDGTIVSRLANKFTDAMASIVRNAYNEGLIQPLETYRFLKLVAKSKVIPPEIKAQVKKALTKKSSTDLKQSFAKDMSMLAIDFGASVLDVIGYDGLGFINRVLDPAKNKKATGLPGEFNQTLEDIKGSVKDNTDLPPELDLDKVRPMNSKIGLMAKINRILALDSKSEKLEKIAKLEQEIADANVHNKILAKYLMKKLVKSGISDANFINMLQVQTNATKGFRALTGLKYITVKEGSQGPMKGEHLADNATSMFELLELRFKNLSDKKLDDAIDEILEYHDQWLEDKSLLDLVDKFGQNNPFKDLRIRLLPKANQKDVYTFDLKPAETLIQQREKNIRLKQEVNKNVEINEKFSLRQDALENSRKVDAPDKGISVFDFDDTLARSNSKVGVTMPDGSKRKINATEFALQSADLEAAGAKFDFSEFNKVIDGKKGPLFDLAVRRQDKFTSKDIFILTARPQEAAYAIHAFLKGVGLEIPIENITGLADGKPSAKADWIIEKAANGYNNFYFADDAYKNVKAVQDALDVVDVKNRVELAKFSLDDIDSEFNQIIEDESGVESYKEFSTAESARRGAKVKSKWRYFLPPGAEDLQGLLYDLLSKGKKGDAQLDFFNKHLIKPFARGIAAINVAKEKIAQDFRNLKKQMPQVKKILGKNSGYKDYTFDQAIRVYVWTKLGMKIPGLSQVDQKALFNLVAKNEDLKTFADVLPKITRLKDGYPPAAEHWLVGNTASDMNDAVDKVKRKEYLAEFIEKKNILFSKKNMNKLRAIYGDAWVEAMEDMLFRMENGTNRTFGRNKTVNAWMNWVNNSVGAIMFFNMRSALLQTLSSVNFINWSYNNPMKAAMAFANQPQFWSDFSFIFNSPMLKQRRRGLQTDVNEAEIANAAAGAKNKASAVLAYLLKIGFTPTQIADSFAIAVGGASFYRNRIKDLMKQGMSKTEAEAKAFEDFAEASEKAQQSSRPDLISAQQAGPLGRIILAFQNTPMQYMRLTKKAMRDLVAGRGDAKTNISKILYYGAVQNFIFASLQNAMFALAFADDEEEEELKIDKKKTRIVNGMADTILRGSGLYGAVVSTVKNTIVKFIEQENKGWNADHTYTIIEALNLSPPIGSKLRKIYSGIQTYRFNKDAMKEYGPGLGNPAYEMVGNVVGGVTNLPLDRLFRKVNNVRATLDERNSAWQRIATLLGWSTWDVGVQNRDLEKLKKDIKRKPKKKVFKKKKFNKK